MKKKNNSWYYCNTCEKPMRQNEPDGLCIDCHLYLCFDSECTRCSERKEFIDFLKHEIDKIIEEGNKD